MPKALLIMGLAAIGLLAAACADKDDESLKPSAVGWEEKLKAELPALGHRNWVVVADAAFPLQISPGMEVVVSNEDHFAVLEKVLKALEGTKHVAPKIYLDTELDYVPDELAPGIDACRKRLSSMLAKYAPKPILHEDLIARMDQVARTFKILMIKTSLTLPYTTVFIELDCGYWGPESEAKMRELMKK